MRFALLLFFLVFSSALAAQKLVLSGAYPDPSVVKIGRRYWASATSSNWFPAFPLLYSKDLINWKQRGYVFVKRPHWADYSFWAPEISYDSGRVYIYYTAHKRNGSLCIAVASADRPEGPYRDHGPLICQPNGSIDAFPIRDTSGQLYLVWKEDANSIRLPTIIWASRMNEERTALTGERIELFRNDVAWEHELVEGVSMIRHGNYFYAFYAAAGCCGSRCTYVTGIARAKNVTGPWEKYSRNPVLTDDSVWLCKGHGTPIEKDGKFFFLYHGYDRTTSAFTGREGLLQEFTFTPDDWISFVKDTIKPVERKEIIRDNFNGARLKQSWQWSVQHNIDYQVANGHLTLKAAPTYGSNFIGEKIVSSDYTATTSVLIDSSDAFAGIAAIGNFRNLVTLVVKKDTLRIIKVKAGKDSLLTTFTIPVTGKVYLQMRVKEKYNISFLYSRNGRNFIPINQEPVKGVYLPPWDSPPRAGLLSLGAPGQTAVFDDFVIRAGITTTTDLNGIWTLKRIRMAAWYSALAVMLVIVAYIAYKKLSHSKQPHK